MKESVMLKYEAAVIDFILKNEHSFRLPQGSWDIFLTNGRFVTNDAPGGLTETSITLTYSVSEDDEANRKLVERIYGRLYARMGVDIPEEVRSYIAKMKGKYLMCFFNATKGTVGKWNLYISIDESEV